MLYLYHHYYARRRGAQRQQGPKIAGCRERCACEPEDQLALFGPCGGCRLPHTIAATRITIAYLSPSCDADADHLAVNGPSKPGRSYRVSGAGGAC